MRNKYILPAIFTISALLLFGCSKKETIDGLVSNNKEYEYVDVIANDPSHFIEGVDITEQGLILTRSYVESLKDPLGISHEVKYTLYTPGGEKVKELDIDEGFNVYTLGSNDNIYMINTDLRGDKPYRQLLIYNMDGDRIFESDRIEIASSMIKALPLEDGLEIDIIDDIIKIRTSDELIYLLNKSGEIEVINKNFQTVKGVQIKETKIIDFDIDNKENLIILANKDGEQELIIYDTNKNNIISTQKLDADTNLVKVKYDYSNNRLYGIGSHIIWQINPDGTISDKVLDIARDPLLTEIENAFYIDGDYYIVTAFSTNTNLRSGIFRRKLAEGDTETNQDEITIAIIGVNTFAFKEAIAMFESLNPGTNVVLLEKGDLSYEQFMQVINTEIMAGKGPDLFYGQFPYKSYIDKDLLLDLGEFTSYDNTRYHSNILENSQFNGKQYILPVNFNFPKLFINSQILNEHNIIFDYENLTVDELESVVTIICENNPNGNYFSMKSSNTISLLREVVEANLHQFIDYDGGKVNFTTPEFKELLKKFKNISSWEKPELHNNLVDLEFDSSVLLELNSQYGYDSYSLMLGEGDKASDYIMIDIPILEDGDNFKVFEAEFCGINKKIKNKGLAIEFLEFLSSEGYGIKYNSGGFHINKDAGEWYKKLVTTGKAEVHRGIHKKFGIENMEWDTEKLLTLDELGKFEQMIDSLDTYNFNSLPIFDEVSSYFEGKQGLDITITNIQNKMELVVGE